MSISSWAVTTVSAAAPATLEKEPAITTMANMLGGLIVVLVIIFVLAYIVKRLKLVPTSHGALKTIAVTPLGQREKWYWLKSMASNIYLG